MENNIYAKLEHIQAQLKAPKSQYNKFGKFYYRNVEDILNAVKPLCKEQGTIILLSDTIVQVGERYYIKATATIADIESGKEISASAYARESAQGKNGMDDAQNTGSTSSYARKYALNGLLAIDDTKDNDDPTNDPQAPQKATEEQVQAAYECGVDIDSVIAFYNRKYNATVKAALDLPYEILASAIAKKQSTKADAEARKVFK